MVKKIALEEHFLDPATEPYWRPTMVDVAPAKTAQLYSALTDFGEQRLKMMEQHGIARAILAIAGPGVQVERDTAKAVRAARASNDFLAKEIQKRPNRYSGFAHLPMQDAKAAADELERCVTQLKFCGAMINGHTNGQYLDHPSLSPFWERADALNTLIYIHPTDPVSPAPVLEGHPGLRRATWEWTFETGSHALRLIFAGVFDRFPKARVGLGHMGETLPYLLWRFDSRTGPHFYNVGLKKPVSHYIKTNIEITTSGMCSAEPLNCAIAALGHERIMFAADYPFEKAEEAGHWLDSEKLEENVRADIAYNNAVRLLKL